MATPTSTTAPSEPQDDGQLVVGVLLPRTGSGTGPALAAPMFEALRLARDRINAAGGVNGADVVLVEADEGENAATANVGFAVLFAEGVDAIVGPASSTVALAELDVPVSRGVVTCSPTATSLALDGYPDNQLFFRTVPSDSLQMVALSIVAERTGEDTIAIAFVDDAYGRGLARALENALVERNITMVGRVAFRGDDDLGSELTELLQEDPDIVAVLADAEDGARFLQALDERVNRASSPWIVVNDAFRSITPSSVEDLGVRNRIRGVAPYAVPVSETPELHEPYAAAAFDCLNLIALAAVQAGSDDPARIAQHIAAVSTGGLGCRSFATCKENLESELQIDYNGPSGNTELSTTRGDPVRAWFEQFEFDADGRAETTPAPQDGTFEVVAP